MAFRCATGLALTLLLACAPGCLGSFQPDGGADSSLANDLGGILASGDMTLETARDRFETDVHPMLDARCAACHGKAGSVGPSFLKTPTYETLVAYPDMITADPTQSRLITKGPHNGSMYFTDAESLRVLTWLTLESAALPPSLTASLTTPSMRPLAGANVVDLGALGPPFAGATLTFQSTFLGSTLELSQLSIVAGGASGLHVVHPLFIVWSNGKKIPDPVDSFAALDETIAEGQNAPLGPGTLFLNHVGTLDQLSIAFHLLEASGVVPSDGGATSDGGTLPRACQALDAFTANAQPMLSNRCVTCHGGGNGIATAALDMTHVNDLAPDAQDAACGQIRNKVNFDNPAASSLFGLNAPSSNSNHPFKFAGDQSAYTAFVQSVSQWIVKEK